MSQSFLRFPGTVVEDWRQEIRRSPKESRWGVLGGVKLPSDHWEIQLGMAWSCEEFGVATRFVKSPL